MSQTCKERPAIQAVLVALSTERPMQRELDWCETFLDPPRVVILVPVAYCLDCSNHDKHNETTYLVFFLGYWYSNYIGPMLRVHCPPLASTRCKLTYSWHTPLSARAFA